MALTAKHDHVGHNASLQQSIITMTIFSRHNVIGGNLICPSFIEAIFKLSLQVENIRILIPIVLECLIGNVTNADYL